TRALKPEGGHAQADIDLTPELYGSLELHGYTISEWGEIQRDTRIVVVDAPRDLNIAINADRETYLPGDTAALDFTVTGLEGSGVASVLGLAAVDESVFALQEQDPGFLKLYFLLEKELLEPKYDLHGFTLPEMITTPEDDTLLREAQDGAAQASMAGMTTGGGHTLSINTRDEKIRQLEERQMAILRVVGWIMLPFTLILPLSIAALTVIALTHDKVLGRSVLLTLGLIFLLGCLVMVVPMPDWVGGPLDRIGYLLDEIFYSEFALGVVTMLAFISMIAWIALLVRAIREKEWRRLFAQVTLAAHFVVFTLAILLSMTVLESADGWVVVPVLLALLLPPTAFLVWAAGDLWSRRPLPALGTFLLAGLALAAPLLGVAALENSTLAGSAQMGMDRGFGLEEPGMEGEWLIDEELAFDVAEEAPMAQEKEMPVATPAPTTGEAPARAEAPRLRQLFGETMAWIPELVTDDDGALELALPLYDNITTWRLTALAHSQDGRLGATTVGLRVFQDFFVDFDLPYAMTQNDEVALPIAVYNYLEEAQTVRLELEEDSWFELLDEAEKTLTIGANDVEVVRFRIKVTATQGRFRPTVWAYGEKMSDATTSTHDVIITPDGKPFELTWSDRLEDGMERTVEIPDTAAPGAAQIEVKIYPGIMSQVVEGMDAILQMPYGCFEQTSSTTYPNVLVLDYMQTTGQTTPEIQLKAEQYINLGYQRLTTFEVSGGGFSLFGDNPPDRMLTAYGLMEFTDMARVFPIDPAFVDRAAQWLIAQQDSDGSWENDRGLVHEQTWANLGNDRVPVTAYISWALTYAGYAEGPAERGLAYIREHAHQVDDPYAIALVANALVAAEPGESFTAQTLERLAALATVEGDIAYWDSGIATMMGSEGKTGSLETTALAAYAFLQADAYPDLANQALLYLIQQKDPNGTWYSTQATILALKALLKSATAGGERTNATVTVSVNGGQSDPIEVTPETYDVVRVLTFSDVGPGDNVIRIDVDGEGSLMAQITTRFYLPWSEIPVTGPDDAVMTIDVAYDRTTLAVDDMIAVQVTVTLNEPGAVDWALVDLGTPPGFTVLPEALQARINHDLDLPEEYPGGRVKKYELTGRQVLVYLQNLTYGEPLTFEYALRARFPVKAQAPASRTYDYYNPDARGEQQPVIITVEE
ncbi:MAG: hypothetical protein JXB35_00870, partial [Anaerolineae bacterium]|nr:hypothetical protein [Anaerolineae bacterium]